MDDVFVPVGKAAFDLVEEARAARAIRIAELERELMTNPYLPARRAAEAEYLRLTSQDVNGK